MRLLFCFLRTIRDSMEKWHLKIHREGLLKQVQGGSSLHLDGTIKVICPGKLELGRYVYIGGNTYINCMGGVTIGNYTILSRNVTIYSYDHQFKRPHMLPYDDSLVMKPVRIGSYVWVGMNATIAPGTLIGDGAVIGIGAVVSGIVPDVTDRCYGTNT